MNMKSVKEMSRVELEREFEERKRLLIEVRDEIDRRDSWEVKEGVNVDFSQYVSED